MDDDDVLVLRCGWLRRSTGEGDGPRGFVHGWTLCCWWVVGDRRGGVVPGFGELGYFGRVAAR